ncbi:AAA family ATPase [Hoylesella marshii]|uniref:Cytidylate kinase n=1 Tax=Hoylesella marshii DSM 16973 = JCM 13450 TaxID=862515 RepID=E0NUP3_9BACT|nr:cytidylate kinase-like family protein [Hoylesella marshii]EFM01150.1 hypothetical protein HMPREF0658_1898 [Hoylesella marshii DSM 16973 = JCM 13450]
MESKRIIINVGRQLGSGGRIIARMLAEDFNCKMYDKEILNLATKESGFSKEFFEQNDEQKGFVRSLFHLHLPYISDTNFYHNKFSQDSLFQFQSDAIRKAAEESSCVFVGRCADYVLRDVKEAVSIFITANLEERLKQVSKRHLCDEETAEKLINSIENERSSYYNYYTGKKWGHSTSYDICVNSSILGIEGTEQLLVDYIKKRMEKA